MTSLLQLDNLDCSSTTTTEQITKLFPKCRPRDVNLNPVTLLQDDTNDNLVMMDRDSDRCASERGDGDQEEDDGNCCDDDSSDDDLQDDEDLIIDHTQDPDGEISLVSGTKSSAYKLRDSRIIEIAGGREVFSQSRSKALRKPRFIEDMEKMGKRNKAQGVWELRSRCADSKKQRSSREVTETVFSTEVRSVRHPRISNSPGGPVACDTQTKNSTSPPLNVAVITGGEVLVFDDIGDDWRGVHLDLQGVTLNENGSISGRDDGDISSGASSPITHYHRRTTDFFNAVTSASDLEGDSLSPEHSNSKVTRIIGTVPIAEYEGSPRRYGPRQHESSSHPVLPSAQSLLSSPSAYPPRPGFPQRVLSSPTESNLNPVSTTPTSTTGAFDYLYEFSETRKVLEEFFKCPNSVDDTKFQDLEYELRRQTSSGSSYVGQRLAKGTLLHETEVEESPRKLLNSVPDVEILQDSESHFLDLSADTGSTEDLGDTEVGLQVGHSRNFTLSPETTDCDSNCGDLDSEVSLLLMDGDSASGLGGDLCSNQDSLRVYNSMPVLEDGLSSGHASDTDNNNPTVMLMKRQITEIEREINRRGSRNESSKITGLLSEEVSKSKSSQDFGQSSSLKKDCSPMSKGTISMPEELFAIGKNREKNHDSSYDNTDPDFEALDPLGSSQVTPPPPAPQPHRSLSLEIPQSSDTVEAAIKDIRLAIQRTKALPLKSPPDDDTVEITDSPIWIPRRRLVANGDAPDQQRKGQGEEGGDEEEPDTDLETDRLLGQQRIDDHGFFDEKLGWRKPKTRTVLPISSGKISCPTTVIPSKTTTPPVSSDNNSSSPPASGSSSNETSVTLPSRVTEEDDGTEKAASTQNDILVPNKAKKEKENSKKKGRNKEVMIHEPAVLIEGVLFRARYLGSTQLVCEGQPTKTTRMMQAEEAVSRIKEAASQVHVPGCHLSNFVDDLSEEDEVNDVSLPSSVPGAGGTIFRLLFLGSVEVDEEGGRRRRKRLKKHMVEEAVTKIKAPEGETQPSTEVDLFISTEKIMVLNTDLKEIMMDHALRTISYIADIGDLVVLMARRRFVPHDVEEAPKINRTPKMICHVFESEEAQFIAQSIGQAFQVAYMEFLKANGIEDHSFVKEMDYQEVLNSQEIFGDELQMFAKKEMQKEVVVPKAKGEILGVVIVESGWGSMLPTVVIANLAPAGAAARCGQLNIGDQIIAINGVSLVGLPLSTCQNYIKNSKNQTVVKLTVVPCPPVVEVKIKRPDTKYQLGFSVQNGVICSLLRGGIAERGGVRVGHRIIEINNQSVVAVPHEKIVNLLATSVGEILMKTMPTSMFRLLTGQETPIYI